MNDKGQGLTEYALIVLLVVFVFWVAVKGTNVGNHLAAGWGQVSSTLSDAAKGK